MLKKAAVAGNDTGRCGGQT